MLLVLLRLLMEQLLSCFIPTQALAFKSCVYKSDLESFFSPLQLHNSVAS